MSDLENLDIVSRTPFREREINRRSVLQRAIALGLTAPAISALLAACGGDDDDETPSATADAGATDPTATDATSGDATATTAMSTEAPDATAADATATEAEAAITATEQTSSAGPQEIVIAQGLDPESLDPHQTTVSATENICGLFIERVFGYDYETAEFYGELAESWDQVDDTTLEITFREGITFTNGEPMNAEAVKFSIDRLMAATHLTGQQLVNVGVEAEVVDEYTVRITTAAPYPFLLNDFLRVSIVPPEYVQEVGDATFGLEPVGTGPFIFQEWVKGDHVTAVANEAYWGGVPTLTQVTYRSIPEASSRSAALQTGEADLVTLVPIADIPTIDEADDLQVLADNSNRSMYIRLDCGDPRLADVRVRQAFNYAIDKDLIVEALLGGYGTVLDGQPIGAHLIGYNPDLQAYPYDPELAKQLLDEAGFNYETPLTLYTPVGRYVADREIAEAVVGMMREIDVEFTLEPLEFGVWIGKHNDRTLTPMTLIGIHTPSPEAFSLLNYLRTDTIGGFFYNDEYDALITEAGETVDLEARIDLYNQATQLLYDQAGLLFLHQQQDIYGVNTRVQGWEPRPDEFIILNEVSVTN